MADGGNNQPRSSFQQQNGWSLSQKSRMRGRTAPGNLSGISEHRSQLKPSDFIDDAPVSPGTKAPLNQNAGYFEPSEGSVSHSGTRKIQAVSSDDPAFAGSTQLSVSAVAPWEQQHPSANIANTGPFGMYSEVWSGDSRPYTARTQNSDFSQSPDGGHKRSISDRFRPGYLRQPSNQKTPDRTGLVRKKSSTGSSGTNSKTMSAKDGVVTGSGRPKTPSGSREVTPWDYHDSSDSQFATPPRQHPPPMPELGRVDTQLSEAGQGQRRGQFGHRNRNSRDEGNGIRLQSSATDLGERKRLQTKQSRTKLFSRRQTETLNQNLAPHPDMHRLETRATSPAGSIRSTLQNAQTDGSSGGRKQGILGRIGNKLHIGNNSSHEEQNGTQTSSPAYTPSPASMSRTVVHDPSGFLTPSGTGESGSSRHDSVGGANAHISRKDSFLPKEKSKRGLFHREPKAGRRTGSDGNGSRGVDKSGQPLQDGTYFELDKDLRNMKGIVVDDQGGTFDFNSAQPPGGSYFDVPSSGQPSWEAPSNGAVAWDAPDSWAVKKEETLAEKVDAIPEDSGDEDPIYSAISFCIRVFRIDGTFSTLAMPLNSTVNEINKVLGRKSFLQDDLDNYQIIMRKGELQRELASTERPIVMQKRLLERMGYGPGDHIEQEGQDDNSYLCRFTFVPVKVSGYYSLEKEGSFEFERMNKYNNIDLSGRSLITIPIVLYKHAGEIISLNLSRNLALDVPRDFIQSCTHLKEIRYTGNEARLLPPSFSLASRLQVLDVSHNQIDQLENADLGRLSALCSLKIANNRLSQLPLYFTQFKQLRSLNLSSNNFKRLPGFFGELQGLVDLDISFNALEAWPPVEELDSLERFWATNNNLHGAIPEDYINLKNLKDIDVRFNGITNVDVIARLPNVEQLLVAHNSITRFEGFFPRLRWLQIDHNPMTKFCLTASMPTLSVLNLASNKISELDSGVYEKMPNLTKLNLDKNLISNLAIDIGRLSHLEVLTIAKNPLMTFPPTIGCLQELRKLDARECNIKRLPAEIWFCCKLEELNMASNVLDNFPKLTASIQPPVVDPMSAKSTTSLPSASSSSVQSPDEMMSGEDRRPSHTSGSMLSHGSSPASSTRKGSVMSANSANTVTTVNGRKPSMPSRQPTDTSGHQHREGSSRMSGTFAVSLRNLCLADNRLRDEVFDSIALLGELKALNLSYNFIDDLPSGVLRKWASLQELYLSGNELSNLPTEDLGHVQSLKFLHLNGNKFQTLPAELAKITRLLSLDVGCNSLKYNVANWPYDWNWVWNPYLRYLNFSGNRRLEIKHQPAPVSGHAGGPQGESLTSFNSLQSLRILGLIDVTLTTQHVPDETDDRRVRTTGSVLGGLRYGMADSLGKLDHLSTLDLMIPKFRGHDNEYLVGMFDGQASSGGGSRVARFLQENFKYYFAQQLAELMSGETPSDALRRTFLTMNKDLITFTTSNFDATILRLKQTPIKHAGSAHALNPDDRTSGGVATVLFIQDMVLYVANVGNAQAVLIPSDGSFRQLTEKHEPANTQERERIREAGGFVSRYGKLNDSLDVSRAFGYAQHVPAIMAAPNVMRVEIQEQDEMILVASKEFWEYVTPDLAIDLARSEREDTMHAAQKLRDLAIAYGASSKIMVMVIGLNGLRKSSRGITYARQRKKREPGPDNTRLALLEPEVDAPTGDIALVFTDIKSSTALWEKTPTAMRSAIRMHNELMRRQLRIIGGYEVKTEGDAFMIAFPTPTSALLWTFSVQNSLLTQDWPTEILDSIHGEEILDDDGERIYRGLSVRMGIHWGCPVWETDPITHRMDYFGPMVNRAARIQGVADGGEITCSGDFIAEIERSLELYADPVDGRPARSESTGSDETVFDDSYGQAIRRDLRALSQQGYEVKNMGETKLKGIENPETLFQIYPHALAGRQVLAESRRLAAAATSTGPAANAIDTPLAGDPVQHPAVIQRNTQLNIEAQNVWDIWTLSLRLEMLCSALEDPSVGCLKSPETAIMERMRREGGEVTDKVLVQFMEHLICRIETCVNTLSLRNLLRPFDQVESLFEIGGPMRDLFAQLTEDLRELQMYRKERRVEMRDT